MLMRLRLPELLEESGLTAYGIAKRSEGRIVEATLYRLVQRRGRVRYLDTELLETLCDVLGVGPEQLLEREREGKATKRRGRA